MPDPIRISAVIGNLNKEHGGAQQLLYDVFSRLPGDIEPTVYHLFGPGTFRDDFEEAGIRVRDLRARSNYDIAAFGRLVRRLRADRPDLVQTNSPISGVWGRIAGRLAGVPDIVSVEHNVHGAYRPLPRVVNGMTLPLARAIVGVSRNVTGSLAAWEKALLPRGIRVLTILNGVDVQRFRPDDSSEDEQVPTTGETPVVGIVGRLVEAKGVDRLLRAWPEVLGGVPEARLQVVGDGPMREELEDLAAGLGIEASVSFLGYRADPVPAYRRFDVAAFPSRWEGLPLTALEAMAAGVPIVASDIPPLRHVVGASGEAGLLVPGDDVRALAEAIVRLLADSGRARRLADAGRERVRRHFSLDRVVASYESLYRDLAGG